MTEGVIDCLETIEVEDGYSERIAFRLFADGILKRRYKSSTIGQACQEVGGRSNHCFLMRKFYPRLLTDNGRPGSDHICEVPAMRIQQSHCERSDYDQSEGRPGESRLGRIKSRERDRNDDQDERDPPGGR